MTSSHKRHRDYDAAASPPQILHELSPSARPNWDKTTYRISQIPGSLDSENVCSIIREIFKLGEEDFKLHSLASDVPDQDGKQWKTSTVSFWRRPLLLEGSEGTADSWTFEIPSIGLSASNRACIHFDTHFNGFTPLSPEENDAKHRIDCIVVPGWGGHPLGSFRSRIGTHVWLRDSLSEHCAQLRVWVYGYRSYLLDQDSSADVFEYAERFRRRLRILRKQTKSNDESRPLIFLLHSLGGWIFKDAIIQMSESQDSDDKWIVQCTFGALFFGVPSLGMDMEAIAAMVQDLPARYISALLDQRDGFRLRQRQHDLFCKAFGYKDSKIVQFFELKKSPTVVQDPQTKQWTRTGPPALLVSPGSASCGRPWETGAEYAISLNGNHSDMVKFYSTGLDDYVIVRDVLQTYIKDACSIIKSRMENLWANGDSPPTRSWLEQQQHWKKACLQSLYFSEMNWRRNDIAEPEGITCAWILQHPKYRDWQQQRHGLIWIKGKPGAGKSTVVKYALENTQHEVQGLVLASFFFHGRGAPIQKNALGLLRSLLHQILLQVPVLLLKFASLFKSKCETEGDFGTKWDWHEKELKKFLSKDIVEVADKYQIRIYVDALDECGEDVAIDLVEMFQHLARSLAICFACRHYPIISLESQSDSEVCVEHENDADIEYYISNRVKAGVLREETVKAIQHEIQSRAEGNFQWVVLVVPRVLRLCRKGKSLIAIRKMILDIPSELDSLYQELLSDLDEDDLPQSLRLMQWICFAVRPLTLPEVRYAMTVSASMSYTSIAQCECSQDFVLDEQIERRVCDLSRGLAEVEEHKNKQRVVQFVHQSVNDFLLERGLRLMDSSTNANVVAQGHFEISRSCLKILSMEEIVRWCSEYRQNSPPRYSLTVILDNILPIWRYAAMYWIVHVRRVEEQNVSQEDILLFFHGLRDILQPWIQVSRLIEDNEAARPANGTTLLHIASRYHLLSVIEAIIIQDVDLNAQDKTGRSALYLAVQQGYEDVVELLLMREDVETDAQDLRGRTPLSLAAEAGHERIVSLLLARTGNQVDLRNINGQSPLYRAVSEGQTVVVEMLLARGDVDVNSKDALGKAPLHRAAQLGFELIVELLLKRPDIDVNARDNYGMTALSLAVEKGYEGVVKLILEKEGVDTMTRDKWGKTPIAWATEKAHRGLMELLLPRVQLRQKDPVTADRGLKDAEALNARPEQNDRDSDVKGSPETKRRRATHAVVNEDAGWSDWQSSADESYRPEEGILSGPSLTRPAGSAVQKAVETSVENWREEKEFEAAQTEIGWLRWREWADDNYCANERYTKAPKRSNRPFTDLN